MARISSNTPSLAPAPRMQSFVTAALLFALGGCEGVETYADSDMMDESAESDGSLSLGEDDSAGDGPADYDDLGEDDDKDRAAAFVITPALADIGIIDTGKSGMVVLTIKNNLGSTQQLKSVAVAGAGFTLASKTCGATLAAGKTCTATVKFTPTAAGEKSATLKVTGTASSAQVAVKGTGSAVTYLAPGTVGNKWFPGHYQTIISNGLPDDPTWLQAKFQAAIKHPKMRGVFLYMKWV